MPAKSDWSVTAYRAVQVVSASVAVVYLLVANLRADVRWVLFLLLITTLSFGLEQSIHVEERDKEIAELKSRLSERTTKG